MDARNPLTLSESCNVAGISWLVMPALPLSRTARVSSSTNNGTPTARFTTASEFFVRLDGCAAFWTIGNEGCPAIRTEFAPFPIFCAGLARKPSRSRTRAGLTPRSRAPQILAPRVHLAVLDGEGRGISRRRPDFQDGIVFEPTSALLCLARAPGSGSPNATAPRPRLCGTIHRRRSPL